MIICYTGVYAITAFVGGAVADLVGHVRVFRVGVALTAVALLAGGLAPGLGWLLVARVVQGLGGGLIYGTAPGIVMLAAAPAERGRALGFFNAALALGFALGPLPAGVLTDAFGWRAVLFARVPLAVAVFLAVLTLRVPRAASGGRRFVALADVRRAPVPAVCALAFLSWAGIFAIWLLVPFYLVERRGFGAALGGAIFTLAPLATTLAAPVAGRLLDRIGPATPVIAGLALETTGLGMLAFADATMPTLVVAAALVTAGAGQGIFQVPMMALVMAAFPQQLQGAAGGLTFLARTAGLVSGVIVLAAVFAARRTVAGFDAAFGEAMVVATGLVAFGAALAAVQAPRWGRRAR